MFDDSIDKPPLPTPLPGDAPPSPDGAAPPPVEVAATSPSLARFAVCRWTQRSAGNGATHCTHPEVLPFAGAHGFNAESWCGDCQFFKVRRVARKSQD
jgi:hypothetical protein